MRERAEDPDLRRDVVEVGGGGLAAEPDLELVEDLAVPDLLRLPDVGVERAVHRRRVGQHRDQLEDVAVHLELDPGHVVEDVAVPLAEQTGVAHREVHRAQVDGRVLLADPGNVLDQPEFSLPEAAHLSENTVGHVQSSESAAIRMGTPTGRAVIAAAVLGSGMTLLDGTVVNVALRTIGEDLDASLAQLQWITNGYLLSLASLILLGGSLGDRFGRRRVFVVGTIWFAGASLLCGLAPTPEVLIVARILQGVGAALLTPGSLSMIQGVFAPRRPAGRDRGVVRAGLHRRRDRSVRRRHPGRVRVVALDLPDQPADGGRHDRDRPEVRPRDPRPEPTRPLRLPRRRDSPRSRWVASPTP